MDEEELTLPADTLQILNEFLQEKALREREEQERVENKAGKDAHFEEDWQLSQFWYSEDTKKKLGSVVGQLVAAVKTDGALDCQIALLSCPSLYATIKDIHKDVKIFEFDQRFAAYGEDFVHYDFNEADTLDYLQVHYNKYDLIIADPPFLAEECITKVAKIIQKVRKPNAKLIFCSGEVVEPWLTSCLDVQKRNFRPEHERNLGNEFVSYANFNLDDFVDK